VDSSSFASKSATEAQAVVSRFFESHVLSVEAQGKVDFHFTHLSLNDTTSLSRLGYGVPVAIHTEHFDSALMVQMPLAGSNLLQVSEEKLRLTPENYSILVPGCALRQFREADCEMLILRIQAKRIRDYVTSYLGFTPHTPLTFSQSLQDAPGPGNRLRRLSSLILEEVGEPVFRPILLHYEQLFIATLLFEHPNTYSEIMSAPRGGAVPRYVRRAEEYIRANAGSDITTESLAREVNATARTLQLAFNKFRGCTPMQMVKAIRLEFANKDLLSLDPESASVTDTALKWGFGHLGAFAQDYRARFGETPSTTLRRKA